MSTGGHHAADDGSLARSTGGAAARGAMLIAVALIIGLVLMAFALDDPDTELTSGDGASDSADSNDSDVDGTDTAGDADGDSTTDSGDTTGGDAADGGTATSAPPETIGPVVEGDGPRPPAEVNVLVANGTGGKGIAGSLADKLIADGYIAKASNAPSTAAGIIYYRQGYADDARAVASILGAAPDILTPAPGDGTIAVAADAVSDGRLTDANVIVIVGDDNAVPTS
jgi:hypothetical protein